MTRLVFTMLLVLLVCTAVMGTDANKPSNKSLTLWLSGSELSGDSTNIGTWVGYRKTASPDYDIEAGLAVDWKMWNKQDSDENTQSDFAVGVFGLLHANKLIDVNNPIPAEGFPTKLIGSPFVGVEYLVDLKGKGTSVSPLVGARIFDAFALAYKYRIVQGEDVDNESEVSLSLQFKY